MGDGARRSAASAAGLLSLLAGFLHGSVIGEHLEEWWLYGAFFVVASIGQGLYGLILLALPRRPAWPAAQWERWKRILFLVGLAGNLAVLGLYVVTRTVGVPLGPAAGEVEPVGPLDLATKAAELATVVLLAWLCTSRPSVTATPQPA